MKDILAKLAALEAASVVKTKKLNESAFASDDGIYLGARVYPEWDQTGEPFIVMKIVDDQQVIVKDDYGNTHKMMINDLVEAQEEGIDEAKAPSPFRVGQTVIPRWDDVSGETYTVVKINRNGTILIQNDYEEIEEINAEDLCNAEDTNDAVGKRNQRRQGNPDPGNMDESAYTGDYDTDEAEIQELMAKYHWTRSEAEEWLITDNAFGGDPDLDEGLGDDFMASLKGNPATAHAKVRPQGGADRPTPVAGPGGRAAPAPNSNQDFPGGKQPDRPGNRSWNENKEPTKKFKVIAEGTTFTVSDPAVAKILRRFPHEVKNFSNGEDLSDHLFDALYDHWLDNGDMPYGVAKARDGDPYNWVSNRLDATLNGNSAANKGDMGHVDIRKQATGMGEAAPIPVAPAASVVDEAPMDPAQQARRKQQDAQWAAAKAKVDAGGNANSNPFAGSQPRRDTNAEFDWRSQQGGLKFGEGLGEDSVDPTIAPGEEIVTENNEQDISVMLDQIGLDQGLDYFFDQGDLHVIGSTTARLVINALKTSAIIGNPELHHIGGEEYSIEFQPVAAVDESQIEDHDSDDDMFFGDGNVTEGAVKDASQALKELSDEEFLAKYKKTKAEFRKAMKLKEDVSLNISANGEEDVLNVIRKLSGLGNSSAPVMANEPAGIEVDSAALRSEPSMSDLIGSMDQAASHAEPDGDEGDQGIEIHSMDMGNDEQGGEDFQYDDQGSDDNQEIEIQDAGPDEEEEVEETYANEPNPQVHTSTDQMMSQGNDLNRQKRQDYPIRGLGNNPMSPVSESRSLMQQYEFMLRSIKTK